MQSEAKDTVIKTLVRHIADDPQGAVSVLQDALETACEEGKALGRKEAFDAIVRAFEHSSEPGTRLLGGMVKAAMANVLGANAIAALQHKEGERD